MYCYRIPFLPSNRQTAYSPARKLPLARRHRSRQYSHQRNIFPLRPSADAPPIAGYRVLSLWRNQTQSAAGIWWAAPLPLGPLPHHHLVLHLIHHSIYLNSSRNTAAIPSDPLSASSKVNLLRALQRMQLIGSSSLSGTASSIAATVSRLPSPSCRFGILAAQCVYPHLRRSLFDRRRPFGLFLLIETCCARVITFVPATKRLGETGKSSVPKPDLNSPIGSSLEQIMHTTLIWAMFASTYDVSLIYWQLVGQS